LHQSSGDLEELPRTPSGDRERFPKRICISARIPISIGDAAGDPFYQPETLTREGYLKELAIFDARIFRQGNLRRQYFRMYSEEINV